VPVRTAPHLATRVVVRESFKIQRWVREMAEQGLLSVTTETGRDGRTPVTVIQVNSGVLLESRGAIYWRDDHLEGRSRALVGDLSWFYELQDSGQKRVKRSRRLCDRCGQLSGVEFRPRLFTCSICGTQTFPPRKQ
jgi:hypothetical protein